MKTSEGADGVMAALDGLPLGDRLLSIKPATQKKETSAPVKVGGIGVTIKNKRPGLTR